ncbi:MAG: lipoyl(octanoyl) transferase LipB [Verrucomicrobiales bacterium]
MPTACPFAIEDYPGLVAYEAGLAAQEDLHARRRAGQARDTLILLEHEPVYTIGRTGDQSSLRSPEFLPHPVHVIGRGGKATYHGPGQLTGYLIADLAPYGRDLHRWLRLLENSLIDACSVFEVRAATREGMTGVWVGDRKLASIGVGVRQWVTLHGFGINLTTEALRGFQTITPCGLDGVSMTCLNSESPHAVTRESFSRALIPALVRRLDNERLPVET